MRDLAPLRNLSAQMDTLGMACCSRPLARALDALVGRDDAGQAARTEAVLRAYYVLRLASAQETIASMMGRSRA